MSSVELTTVTLTYPGIQVTDVPEVSHRMKMEVDHFWLDLEDDKDDEHHEKVAMWFYENGFVSKTVRLPEISPDVGDEFPIWIRKSREIYGGRETAKVETACYGSWTEMGVPVAVVAAMKQHGWGL